MYKTNHLIKEGKGEEKGTRKRKEFPKTLIILVKCVENNDRFVFTFL